ncbi:MAG: DUF2760 domain-containing protein [Planctomycetota bacterium]|nr:MAG: DUF2760 domain-containing protein [Planctomycetota bacterium]
MRLILAIQCFFALLFSGRVPARALPGEVEEERQRLARERDEARAEAERLRAEVEEKSKALAAAQEELAAAREALAAAEEKAARAAELEARLSEAQRSRAETEKRLGELRAEAEEARDKLKEARDAGALALLAWLQREGRLVDFLREDIDDYDDEQVGAAVRAIHKGCAKVLAEGFELEPVLDGEEEASVEVPAGFDPVAIQLSGAVKGDPPFRGTLMHRGWRVTRIDVPVPETVDPRVLAPAEVEL